tara:strand:- start:10 stop:399 length:390 start_codon:yes stop_codon:yes gene_type:complete
MGRKGYQGESPADRSINLMDKFIRRNEKKQSLEKIFPGRRKDKNIPMDLWPLKDQIEYWDSLTPADWFDRKYPSYIDWLDELQSISAQYPTTFTDQISGHKDRIQEVFNKKIKPRKALDILRKEGIIWV